jgi:hypothetical protein
MFLSSFLFILIMIISIPLVIFSIIRRSNKIKKINKINEYFDLASKMLQDPVHSTTSVRGYYQDREVTFARVYDGEAWVIKISMSPNQIERKPRRLLLLLPRPTQDTRLDPWRNIIFYKKWWRSNYYVFKDQPSIKAVLEELRKATSTVETGAPYFRE